jgi:predicted dienelactone hydrolase
MGKPFGRVSIASSTGQAESNAPQDLAAGPYPLVILSPGFSIGSTAYAWIAEHLASYGFVVISPEHNETLDPENQLWQAAITRPQDILKIYAYIDKQVQPGGSFEDLVDPDLVAVIGHSYGGYTSLAAAGAQIDTDSFVSHCQNAIDAEDTGAWLCEMLLPHTADMANLAGLDAIPEGLWPAWADPRVDAIVSMAGDAFFFGQDGLANIHIPVMAIGGTADADSPYMWSTYPAYEYTASQAKVKIALKDAEHMIFTGPCQTVPFYLKPFAGEFCDDASWNRTRAHEFTNHFVTAFLLAELKDDRVAAASLSPDKIDFTDIEYEAIGF